MYDDLIPMVAYRNSKYYEEYVLNRFNLIRNHCFELERENTILKDYINSIDFDSMGTGAIVGADKK